MHFKILFLLYIYIVLLDTTAWNKYKGSNQMSNYSTETIIRERNPRWHFFKWIINSTKSLGTVTVGPWTRGSTPSNIFDILCQLSWKKWQHFFTGNFSNYLLYTFIISIYYNSQCINPVSFNEKHETTSESNSGPSRWIWSTVTNALASQNTPSNRSL